MPVILIGISVPPSLPSKKWLKGFRTTDFHPVNVCDNFASNRELPAKVQLAVIETVRARERD